MTAVKNTADRGKASLKSAPTIKGTDGRTEAGLQASVTLTDRASGASAYAKLQSNIADILADLKHAGGIFCFVFEIAEEFFDDFIAFTAEV